MLIGVALEKVLAPLSIDVLLMFTYSVLLDLTEEGAWLFYLLHMYNDENRRFFLFSLNSLCLLLCVS